MTIDLDLVSRVRRKIRTAHKPAAGAILEGFTRLRFISSINTNVNKLKTYRLTSFESNRIKHYMSDDSNCYMVSAPLIIYRHLIAVEKY